MVDGRDRKEICKAKLAKGGNSASTWFLKGDTTSTVTCCATPNSELQKLIKEYISKEKQADGGKTLVLEDGGLPITLGLKKKNPFRVEICTFNDPNCMVDRKTDCSKQNVTYIVTCNGCPDNVSYGPLIKNVPQLTEVGGEGRFNYVGMTGTSMHARAKMHASAISANNMSNALCKHVHNAHNGISPGFMMKMCASHVTVMNRYKTEAIFIENQLIRTPLNDRLEGGRGSLVRIDSRINRM